VVGVLLAVLAMLVFYVTATNKVSENQGRLAGLQQELNQTQALAGKLSGYTQFAALAKARVQTVQEIASGRFDWDQALSDLSRVVPANTSLTSVTATVSPTSGAAGTASSAGGLRGDLIVPAFELSGCTSTQDDVARLMSRLRLIRGVSRVTLSDAVKPAGSATPTPVPATSTSPGGCGASAPTFDLVVFFQPLPTVTATPAGATGPTGALGVAPTGSSQ
jgi:Tfp pilus assembly protein PilN